MSNRTFATVTGLLISAAQIGFASEATAQAANAYGEYYLHQCQLNTGGERLACFDQLGARIPGFKGHGFGATPMAAITARPAQFVGTAATVQARPYRFLEDYNP
ncbi:MAG: hypothetical protein ACKVQU_17925 [Burkholderiales bacterium]